MWIPSYNYLFQFLILTYNYGLAKSNSHVKNTESIKQQNYDFIVSIQLKNFTLLPKERHLCTGAIISDKLVLTQGECLMEYDELAGSSKDKYKIKDVQVATIGDDAAPSEKLYDIQSWAVYNDGTNVANPLTLDIAIITLKDSVDLYKNQKADISNVVDQGLSEKAATLLQWTITNNQEHFIKRVPLLILKQDDCNELMAIFANIENASLSKTISCSIRSDNSTEILDTPGMSGQVVVDESGIIALGYGIVSCNLFKCMIVHDNIEKYQKIIRNVIKAS